MNKEIDEFIKLQAAEAEKDFKKNLEGIVKTWKEESEDILEQLTDQQEQQEESFQAVGREINRNVDLQKTKIDELKESLLHKQNTIQEKLEGLNRQSREIRQEQSNSAKQVAMLQESLAKQTKLINIALAFLLISFILLLILLF